MKLPSYWAWTDLSIAASQPAVGGSASVWPLAGPMVRDPVSFSNSTNRYPIWMPNCRTQMRLKSKNCITRLAHHIFVPMSG